MPFKIPNARDAGFLHQSGPDSVDFDILAAAFMGTGVVSGCAVTAQVAPDGTVAVATGEVKVLNVDASVAGGNVDILPGTPAHATLPRFDLVVADDAGALSKLTGTPSLIPEFPEISPEGSLAALASVYVPPLAGIVTDGTGGSPKMVVDKRVSPAITAAVEGHPRDYDATVGPDGDFDEITDAIAADAVSILVRPKAGGGRYDAFTVNDTDAAKLIVGSEPRVLVGAITLDKNITSIENFESNGRVTVAQARVACHINNVVCNGPSGEDCGFAFELGSRNLFVNNIAVDETSGVALVYGENTSAVFVNGFTFDRCGGPSIVEVVSPKTNFLTNGKFAHGFGPAPTVATIDIQAGGSPGRFIISNIESDVDWSPQIKARNCEYLRVTNFIMTAGHSSDPDLPTIDLDETCFNAVFKGIYSAQINPLFGIPSTVVTPGIVLEDCMNTGGVLVTGTGKYDSRGINFGGGSYQSEEFNVGIRLAGGNILVPTDNTRQVGSVTLALAQMWAHIHGVKNYIELIEAAQAAAPAVNRARFQIIDNGAGKTQVVVRFNTGAVQVIATEP